MIKNKNKLIIQAVLLLILATTAVFFLAKEYEKKYDETTSNLVIHKSPGLWRISKGSYRADNDLLVPLGINLVIEPGVQIYFAEGKLLLVEENLTAVGTSNSPILLTSQRKNSFWRGVTIRGRESQTENIFLLKDQISRADFLNQIPKNPFQLATTASKISHVIIENVSVRSPKSNLRLNYMAGLEILNSEAKIDSVQFKNIQKIGLLRSFNSVIHVRQIEALNDQSRKGIHINNSIALVHENRIEGNQEAHICYDGIWAVNSFVSIQNNTVIGKGDDGIDLKNSLAILSSNSVNQSKDEGIDVDHQSFAILLNNQIDQAENGIQVSGESSAVLRGNSVQRTTTGLLKRDAYEVWDQDTRFSGNTIDTNETTQFVRPEEDRDISLNRDQSRQSLQLKTWMVPNKSLIQIPQAFDRWIQEARVDE